MSLYKNHVRCVMDGGIKRSRPFSLFASKDFDLCTILCSASTEVERLKERERKMVVESVGRLPVIQHDPPLKSWEEAERKNPPGFCYLFHLFAFLFISMSFFIHLYFFFKKNMKWIEKERRANPKVGKAWPLDRTPWVSRSSSDSLDWTNPCYRLLTTSGQYYLSHHHPGTAGEVARSTN